MKRILALLLALLMMSAAALADGRKISVGDFSVTIPYSWEDELDSSDDEPDYQNLGFYYSPEVTGLNVEIYRSFIPEWEKTTLMGSDSTLQEYYLENTMGFLADYNPQYLKTIYNMEGIPILLIAYSDELGPLFYGETLLDGWFYSFYSYAFTNDTYSAARELTDDDLALTEEIFSSVRFGLF